MRLNERTVVYVTAKDGTSQMTLGGLVLSFQGGTQWHEIEVTTDPNESKLMERKRSFIQQLNGYLNNMTPNQVEKALDKIMKDDGLMTLAEEYA